MYEFYDVAQAQRPPEVRLISSRTIFALYNEYSAPYIRVQTQAFELVLNEFYNDVAQSQNHRLWDSRATLFFCFHHTETVQKTDKHIELTSTSPPYSSCVLPLPPLSHVITPLALPFTIQYSPLHLDCHLQVVAI